jgi:argininosuccinate lyase
VSTSAKPWEHAKLGQGSASDPLAARFVESLSFDTRLYDADIRGSLAHAAMLHRVGLLTESELRAITDGLAAIRAEVEAAPAGPTAVGVPGAWPGWKFDLEDVHMCIEAALTEKIGDPGRKLHTGRSRNDQVALDLRLWLRDACHQLSACLVELLGEFKSLAERDGDTVLASYTHLQRAQPIVVGAECMAWHTMFQRDRSAFERLASDPLGIGSCPLGSGAVAGSTLPLDRSMTASALGFAAPTQSSIDSTASRDEALDFVYLAMRTALHLSRLAEQWIIYCTTEFGFVSLGPAYTTGSSMMPQKRNPDMLELIRGKSGTVAGHFHALSMIIKGLPLAYNRDLQEDKRHVFAAHDTLIDCLRMAAGVVRSARFEADHIRASLDRGHLDATVLAEFLVSRGVPFRTGHQIVGALVRLCDERQLDCLSQLSLSDFNAALSAAKMSHIKLTSDVFDHLGAHQATQRYQSLGHGGTGPGGYRDWLRDFVAARAGETAAAHAPLHPRAQTGALFGDDNAIADADDAPHSPGKPAADWSTLIAAYAHAGRTLDDLPYTPEFDALLSATRVSHPNMSARDVFRRLCNLRKAGKLPRVGRAESSPARIDHREEAWLESGVAQVCGSLGQRDQLPYDERFVELLGRFNAFAGRSLSPHDLWRVIAKLAK